MSNNSDNCCQNIVVPCNLCGKTDTKVISKYSCKMHLWKFEEVVKHFIVFSIPRNSQNLDSWIVLETRVNYRSSQWMLELNLPCLNTSEPLPQWFSQKLDMACIMVVLYSKMWRCSWEILFFFENTTCQKHFETIRPSRMCLWASVRFNEKAQWYKFFDVATVIAQTV